MRRNSQKPTKNTTSTRNVIDIEQSHQSFTQVRMKRSENKH
jgi:hypothetical protein